MNSTAGFTSRSGIGDLVTVATETDVLRYESMADSFIAIVYPIIGGAGVLGNVLSFAVMISRKMRKQSTSVYLTTLAVVDTMRILYIMVAVWSARAVFGVQLLFLESDVLQRVQTFWMFFPTSLSSWLVVAVCGERLIITSLPLCASTVCTRSSAASIVLILTLLCAGYSLACSVPAVVPNPRLVTETSSWLRWSLVMITSVIPTICLTIMTVAIAAKLRSALRADITCSSTNRNKSTARATKLVLVVCAVFVLLMLPSTLLLGVYGTMIESGIPKPEIALVKAIGVAVMLLNNSLNFVLYMCASSKLRNMLKQLLSCNLNGEDTGPKIETPTPKCMEAGSPD